MKKLFLIFALTFWVLSCGPPPQTGKFYVPEVATTSKTRAGQEQASLPASGLVDLRKMPYVRNVFKTPLRPGNGGLDDVFATLRSQVDNIAIISNGSLDVLKAFIAEGWAPIVLLRSQRSQEVLSVVRYNDGASELYLQNPNNLSERRMSYNDFGKAWAASRSKCLLITAQNLSEAKIQEVLGGYLPAESFGSLSVRSKRHAYRK